MQCSFKPVWNHYVGATTMTTSQIDWYGKEDGKRGWNWGEIWWKIDFLWAALIKLTTERALSVQWIKYGVINEDKGVSGEASILLGMMMGTIKSRYHLGDTRLKLSLKNSLKCITHIHPRINTCVGWQLAFEKDLKRKFRDEWKEILLRRFHSVQKSSFPSLYLCHIGVIAP